MQKSAKVCRRTLPAAGGDCEKGRLCGFFATADGPSLPHGQRVRGDLGLEIAKDGGIGCDERAYFLRDWIVLREAVEADRGERPVGGCQARSGSRGARRAIAANFVVRVGGDSIYYLVRTSPSVRIAACGSVSCHGGWRSKQLATSLAAG